MSGQTSFSVCGNTASPRWSVVCGVGKCSPARRPSEIFLQATASDPDESDIRLKMRKGRPTSNTRKSGNSPNSALRDPREPIRRTSRSLGHCIELYCKLGKSCPIYHRARITQFSLASAGTTFSAGSRSSGSVSVNKSGAPASSVACGWLTIR